MKRLLILVGSLLSSLAFAQINYSTGSYRQEFDTLQNNTVFTDYTSMPTGWFVSHGSYVATAVTNGYSNNYGTYCFATALGASDKALGLVIGSTGQAYMGAQFRNTSGGTLTSITLSYTEEQWAKGAVTANDQVIPFEYSLGASSLTAGTYTGFSALDMHSINDGDGVFARLDGNAAGNHQVITATITGLSWAPNQDLWIRWDGVSHSFNSSHAMAIDNLTFSAVPEPGSAGLGAAGALLAFRFRRRR